MTTAPLPSLPFRSAALSSRKANRFDFRPNVEGRAAIAVELGLLDLPALRLKGEIRPTGRNDFELVADLTADIVQPCSVTLAPVPSSLTENVRRLYLADWQDPDGDEVEMPEDDTRDPLPEVIDVATVALEALALALPLYPRAPGAELGEAVYTAPGATPLRDEDLRPFAGLAALKSRLAPGEGNE